MQHLEDFQLVERVLAKERVAFEEFFEGYFPRLSRFCAARISHQDAVEDIVQETLIKAVRNLHTYRGEAMLFSWLCQICRNEMSNWYTKNHKKHAAVVSLDDDPAVRAALESFGAELGESMSNQIALVDLVQMTLDYLPDVYSKVLELKYLEGLSVKEISLRTGAGRLATQSTLARARKSFRECFRDLQQERVG